jgi:2-keto-4-pentenoate hydratase/2-oxohepta-3-ene-1,7-dioic acid hydratase in catechol pathway
MKSTRSLFAAAVLAALVFGPGSQGVAQSISDAPDTPFKLATFQSGGNERVGLVLGPRILDIGAANEYLVSTENISAMTIPYEMRALIEEYATVKGRLYQIANYFSDKFADGQSFAYDINDISIQAPIKYPWNVIAAAANYKAHAVGMSDDETEEDSDSGRGGFNASRIDSIVPERDAPVMFAKSPRSCIIGPGEPYFIPPGRERIDWEGEMAIIIGKPAYLVSNENAHDYVFGYSIMYDLSDRGSRTREVSMFPGPNWFDGKSTNRGAPFGPYIVPKEFLPNHANLRLITRVNGKVMQDQSTADLIWNEANLIRYTTSILMLYPGDVISTGTPSGTGAERGEFLSPGDVVTIELEGVGILETPIKKYVE